MMKTVSIKINNQIFEFNTDKHYSILSLCKRQNINIPHSCFEGRCGLCKAKLLKGEVEEIRKQGLSQEERTQGYILTCQSRLESESVNLDFD